MKWIWQQENVQKHEMKILWQENVQKHEMKLLWQQENV